MNGLFIEILNMSFSAGCVALIVMAIRPFLRKMPKIYSYALWAVVFFRFVFPFTISLPMSAVPVQPQTIPRDIVSSGSPSIQSGVSAIDHAVNTTIERSLTSGSVESSVNTVQTALEIGSYLWLAGVLALLLYGMISYLYLKKRVATAIRVHDNIYETDLIQTPFVLGFLRARIYVPTGLGDQELEYVTAHERTHIRRLDYLIKPFAFLVVSVHWFNPLAWISYALLARDMELSADESVIKRYDFDIRGNYSKSLLALSVKRSGLLSPLAFGETGVRTRVRNVLNYRKPAFWISVAAAVIVAVASLSLLGGRQMDMAPEVVYHTEYDRVKIKFLSDQMGFKAADEFETADAKIVASIDKALGSIRESGDNDDLNNNHTNRYTIELSNKTGGYSCELYYDTLYDKAYVIKDGGCYETDTDFARYIDSFLEHGDIVTGVVDADAGELFQKYGWTIDYRISATKRKLNDINDLSSFNPNAYYFAYNNELSKDIGLDMSSYSDTSKLNVEIYRLRESMPQEFYPIRDCRGIVVKKGDKIIGAYISAGRHSAFNACSLKGSDFEAAAGQTLDRWLAARVKAGDTEKRMARLNPEQVIAEYFTALDRKDTEAAVACISKKALLGALTSNMRNEELFNEEVRLPLAESDIGVKPNFDNLKSAKLLKVELIDDGDENVKVFRVTVDLQYDKALTIENGEQLWDCNMVYESPQTGWKIEGFGHG